MANGTKVPQEIILYSELHKKEVLFTVPSLEDAQRICTDPETSSKTCKSAEGLARTAQLGCDWFFAYRDARGDRVLKDYSLSAALDACYKYAPVTKRLRS